MKNLNYGVISLLLNFSLLCGVLAAPSGIAVPSLAPIPSVSPLPIVLVSPSPTPNVNPFVGNCKRRAPLSRILQKKIATGSAGSEYFYSGPLRSSAPVSSTPSPASGPYLNGSPFTWTVQLKPVHGETGGTTLEEKYQCVNGTWYFLGSSVSGEIQERIDRKWNYNLNYKYAAWNGTGEQSLNTWGTIIMTDTNSFPVRNWNCGIGMEKSAIHDMVFTFSGPMEIPASFAEGRSAVCGLMPLRTRKRKYSLIVRDYTFEKTGIHVDLLNRVSYDWSVTKEEFSRTIKNGLESRNAGLGVPLLAEFIPVNMVQWNEQKSIDYADGNEKMVQRRFEKQNVVNSNIDSDEFTFESEGVLLFSRKSEWNSEQWKFAVTCNAEVCAGPYNLLLGLTSEGAMKSCSISTTDAASTSNCKAGGYEGALGAARAFEVPLRKFDTVYPPLVP